MVPEKLSKPPPLPPHRRDHYFALAKTSDTTTSPITWEFCLASDTP